MSAIDHLASVLGAHSDVPNQELAKKLAAKADGASIRELAENLANKSAAIRSDCVKTLYEIGYLRPDLIADHVDAFLDLLRSKDNRLVWGGMIALSTVADLKAKQIRKRLGDVLDAMQKGSVITVDNAVSVLAKVAGADKACAKTVDPLLIEHLRTCRPKEVGQHAERSLPAITKANKEKYAQVLSARLDSLVASQKKRVEKVLRQIQSL